MPNLPKLPKPPKISDIISGNNPLRDIIRDGRETIQGIRGEISEMASTLRVEEAEPSALVQPEVTPEEQTKGGTACLQCCSDHLSTIAGALSEAVRFARGDDWNEVGRRIRVAQEELNIAERIDLHPSEVVKLPKEQKEVADWILPKLRELRHLLQNIETTQDIEQTSAYISQLREEYETKRKTCTYCEKVEKLKSLIEKRKVG